MAPVMLAFWYPSLGVVLLHSIRADLCDQYNTVEVIMYNFQGKGQKRQCSFHPHLLDLLLREKPAALSWWHPSSPVESPTWRGTEASWQQQQLVTTWVNDLWSRWIKVLRETREPSSPATPEFLTHSVVNRIMPPPKMSTSYSLEPVHMSPYMAKVTLEIWLKILK